MHDYDETGTCFNCGRPRNAVQAAQEWMVSQDKEINMRLGQTKLEERARNIIEWLLEDLEKK